MNKQAEICKVCSMLESLILDKKAKQLISIGQCNHVVPHRWVKLKLFSNYICMYILEICVLEQSMILVLMDFELSQMSEYAAFTKSYFI